MWSPLGKIRVESAAYIWAAVLLMILPFKWVIAAAIAAVIHELSHLLSLRFLGCAVRHIRIGVLKTQIVTTPLSHGEELICSIAGPAGSLLMLVFWRLFPELALCALIQGIFNLLPLHPMDGGRALRCLIRMVCHHPDRIIGSVEVGIASMLILLSLLAIHLLKPLLPVSCFLLITAGNTILRKIPCKPGRQALQ